MKAIAIFPDSKETRLIEHAEPLGIRPGEVKMRILEVGICGTDRHICACAFGAPPSASEYLVLGHEALGQVLEVGPGVETLTPGDLVVPEVRRPCSDPTCRACRAGRQDFCSSGTYSERGIVRLHGYMTDMVVDEQRYLHRVAPELRDVAVLVEPLTIAEKAFTQVRQMQQRLPWLQERVDGPGHGLKAVVLGAGPIGLLGAMLLIKEGYETYVYSRAPKPNLKADLAEAIGATYFSTETTSVAQFAEQVGQIDLIYEALDASPVAVEVLQYLGRNGVFIFTSQTNPTQPMGIDAARAFRHLTSHNQVLLGTVNASPAAFKHAIEDLAIFQQRWPRALRSLITTRHPMEHFSDVLLNKPDGIKQVISID